MATIIYHEKLIKAKTLPPVRNNIWTGEVKDMEEKNKEKEEFHKDKNCFDCKRLFECKGKPRYITNCVSYEKRIKNGK